MTVGTGGHAQPEFLLDGIAKPGSEELRVQQLVGLISAQLSSYIVKPARGRGRIRGCFACASLRSRCLHAR